MTATILADTTTGAAAPSDTSLSVVEINTAITDSGGPAFDFDDTTNSTLIVAGIVATTFEDSAVLSGSLADGSEVVVAQSGIISGQIGIESFSPTLTVTNEGLIEGDILGIFASGAEINVVNTGTISVDTVASTFDGIGIQLFVTDFARAVNEGVIGGGRIALDLYGDNFTDRIEVTNTGLLEGEEHGITVNNATLILNNSGEILASTFQALEIRFDAVGEIVNSGLISSASSTAIDFQNPGLSTVLFNTGEITSGGGFAIDIAGDAMDITNAGLIAAEQDVIVVTEESIFDLWITNSGQILSMAGEKAIWISPESDMDATILNTGEIVGDVTLKAGDDLVLSNGAGSITGAVETGGGSDFVQGGQYVDQMDGGAGTDILLGGDGADVITGGTGADFLLGEEGADVFLFTDVSDSPPAEADSILDYEQGVDLIDFYQIASAFTFLGSGAFTASGGAEIRTQDVGGVITIVRLDADGDGATDLEILVYATGLGREDFGI